MTLHDIIQSDASTVFCNVNDFAEPVTYHPFNHAGGIGRPINAVVDRQALAVFSEDGDLVTPVFEVHIVNDATLGIASDELNLGGDELEFAVRVGQETTRRSIVRLLSHDEGMLVLECR